MVDIHDVEDVATSQSVSNHLVEVGAGGIDIWDRVFRHVDTSCSGNGQQARWTAKKMKAQTKKKKSRSTKVT
jgi:hypothetical protein